MGRFWICPFWLEKLGSVHQPHRPFTGVHVLGRVRPSLAPEFPLILSGWDRHSIISGGGSWLAFCFIFLVLELYLEVFQERFFVFVKVS